MELTESSGRYAPVSTGNITNVAVVRPGEGWVLTAQAKQRAPVVDRGSLLSDNELLSNN